jgi:hypothetical protein
VYRPSSRKSYLDADEIRTISRICGEAAHALGYVDSDFESLPPQSADKVKTSVRLRRTLESIERRLPRLRN